MNIKYFALIAVAIVGSNVYGASVIEGLEKDLDAVRLEYELLERKTGITSEKLYSFDEKVKIEGALKEQCILSIKQDLLEDVIRCIKQYQSNDQFCVAFCVSLLEEKYDLFEDKNVYLEPLVRKQLKKAKGKALLAFFEGNFENKIN